MMKILGSDVLAKVKMAVGLGETLEHWSIHITGTKVCLNVWTAKDGQIRKQVIKL